MSESSRTAILARLIKVLPSVRMPHLSGARTFEISQVSLSQLRDAGIEVIGGFGSGNTITIDGDQPRMSLKLALSGATNTVLFIGKCEAFDGTITVSGDGNLFCLSGIGGQQGQNRIRVNVNGDQNLLHFGRDCTFVDTQFIFDGHGRNLLIGEDCMFSWGITIHNYDHHAIYDMETGDPINQPLDMRIGNHVWVGQDVLITRGVSIGDGSIVGARSVVSRDIEPHSIAVGIPAKVVRSGVRWGRERFSRSS